MVKNKNKIKKILIMLVIINILIIGFSSSYAIFQTSITKDKFVKIEVGTTDIVTTIENYSNNVITLSSGESKTLNITLSNITDYNILYKMYYTIESGTGSVFATSATDNLSGVMKTEKSLTITLQNNGASSITIRIGTKGDLINSEITLEDNQYEITLDNEGPVITTSIASSSQGNNSWYNLLSIKGEAVDARSTVSTISSCITTSTSCTPNSTVEGDNKTVSISTSNSSAQKVCFQATDSIGNQSEITCSDAYKVDVDSPSVTSLSDAGNGKITFTATDIHSGPQEYCVNKSSSSTSGCTWYTASSGSQTTGAIITENNTFYVHLKDNAGNMKHSSAVSVKYDNTGPTVAVSVASSSAGVSSWYSAISIKGTATDDKSTVSTIKSCLTTDTTCTPNSSTNGATATVAITGSNTTARRVCFNATDSYGNTGATQCSSAYKVDQTAPNVTNVSDAGGGKITFTASDSHSGPYQYCVNQSASSTSGCSWKTASSGSQTTGEVVTEDGNYYVHVRDKAYKVGHSNVVAMTVIPNAAKTIIKKYGTGGLIAVNTNGTLYSGSGTIREYRYSGPSVNNYIKFNNGEIWRIIGVFKNSAGDWNLKIMRNTWLTGTELPSTYTYNGTMYVIKFSGDNCSWDFLATGSGAGDSNDWTTAGLQYYLNGSDGYYGTLSGGAKALVDTSYKYYLGNFKYDTATAISGYNDERTASNISIGNQATWNGKIALLYPSDYGYSASSNYWTTRLYTGYFDQGAMNTSWMFKTKSEWLLSPSTSETAASFIHYDGFIASGSLGNKFGAYVRPVLNLLASAPIDANHEGTESDPYVILE